MSDILALLLKAVFYTIQVGLIFFWAYWLFISFFGFKKQKQPLQTSPEKRFLVLIAAHNEEKVIGQLLENLNNMQYPKDLYDVYVIADNCTDLTAEISRNAGANVLEHTSRPDEPKGKPYALRYAFDVLDDQLDSYDAFCVFDADNLVSLNYLYEMNKNLINGDQVIQCYLDTKNPEDNWISLSYATSYYLMNRSWQLAKSNLGLGNAIGGTGFCVTIETLRKVGWTARSLTEDLEFQMQCLLQGIPARWNHTARIFDEKPTGFWASCIQRLRWARGHWDVCFKYVGPLFKKAIFERDILAFDGAMYLLNPGKIVIGTLTALMIYLDIFIGDTRSLASFIPFQVWISCLLFQLMYTAYCMFLDSKFTGFFYTLGMMVKGVIFLPIFNYLYVPLFVFAAATYKNKTWKRTEHTRSVSMDELKLGMLQVAASKEDTESK